MVQYRRIRLESDRLLTVSQRFLGLTAIQQRLAEVGLGRGECRLQFDGEPEMLERLLRLAQLTESDAQVAVGLREVGTQLKSAAKLCDGLRMPSQPFQGRARLQSASG